MSEELIILDDRTVIEVQDPKTGAPTALEMGGEQGIPGPPGPPGVGGELVAVDHTITALDIANKGFTLPKEVYSAAGFYLSVFTGVQQQAQVDFLVSTGSDLISWDGLALELLLEEGDVIHVRYVFL